MAVLEGGCFRRFAGTVVSAACIAAISGAWAPASAGLNPVAAYPLEALCGYAGGAALGIVGIPVGDILITREDYAGGGLVGFAVFYPVGCGLAVYGLGEVATGDAANDGAALSASVGGAAAVILIGRLTAGWKGVFLGILVSPVASTVAYNVVKKDDEEDVRFFVTFGGSF